MLAKKMEKSQSTEKNLEKKRKAFIDKGGRVASESNDPEWMFINLRIPRNMVNKIEEIINTERIGMTRTGWILEAIQEKLKKEEK